MLLCHIHRLLQDHIDLASHHVEEIDAYLAKCEPPTTSRRSTPTPPSRLLNQHSRLTHDLEAVTSSSLVASDFLLPSSPGDSLLLLRRLHLSFPSSPPTSPSVIETKSLVRYNTP
ncbi:hypothetical protein Q3G72_014916 [Acer saccharum]|nr:hypothetical protein Q3G72_014916 [Acer saccharum]